MNELTITLTGQEQEFVNIKMPRREAMELAFYIGSHIKDPPEVPAEQVLLDIVDRVSDLLNYDI